MNIRKIKYSVDTLMKYNNEKEPPPELLLFSQKISQDNDDTIQREKFILIRSLLNKLSTTTFTKIAEELTIINYTNKEQLEIP